MKLEDRIHTLLKNKPNSTVLSIGPERSVFDASEKMAEQGVGALLIMDDDRLLGIVTERDYARKVILKGRLSRETLVREIMTSPVVFVTPQQSVDECMALMTMHRFRQLPVVDDDRVIGVVSIGDLVKWIITGQEHVIQQLESYISATYPG